MTKIIKIERIMKVRKKSKNPISKTCPRCGSINIIKKKDKGFKLKSIKSVKYIIGDYVGKYHCGKCGNIFEQPTIIDRRIK